MTVTLNGSPSDSQLKFGLQNPNIHIIDQQQQFEETKQNLNNLIERQSSNATSGGQKSEFSAVFNQTE